MKRYIIEIKKGKTSCNKCPFVQILDTGDKVCNISRNFEDIDCTEYNLSTIKLTEVEKDYVLIHKSGLTNIMRSEYKHK